MAEWQFLRRYLCVEPYLLALQNRALGRKEDNATGGMSLPCHQSRLCLVLCGESLLPFSKLSLTSKVP